MNVAGLRWLHDVHMNPQTTPSRMTTGQLARALGRERRTVLKLAAEGRIAPPVGRDGRGALWGEASLTVAPKSENLKGHHK